MPADYTDKGLSLGGFTEETLLSLTHPAMTLKIPRNP
jgi:hypothetical protein